MRYRQVAMCAILGCMSGQAVGQVSLWIDSAQQGANVAAGSTVHWKIMCNVDTSGNLGLAGISVDFVHRSSNNSTFDIPAASGVPTGMSGFSRPDGISNAGAGGTGTGYVGTQVGTSGAKDLVEIGGMQNTFGFAGTVMGHDYTISTSDRGIGQQTGGQLIAEGDMTAPSTPGSYVFDLQNGMANVFTAFGSAGQPSAVAPASVSLGSLWFIVGNCCTDDFNGDGDSNTDADIEAFFACIAGNCCSTCASPDYNCDGDSGTDADIESFFRVLAGGMC